jgi:hypothetical protein
MQVAQENEMSHFETFDIEQPVETVEEAEYVGSFPTNEEKQKSKGNISP